MRIIAGTARGRPIRGPKGDGIRPTSDRTRESIFNILGQWLDGLDVLDLFAGTGALAFEALSRGAARAVLVDKGREAVRLCKENGTALGLAEKIEIIAAPVDSLLLKRIRQKSGQFDLVFADPPYAGISPKDLLELLANENLIKTDGCLVLEHDKRSIAPGDSGCLRKTSDRRFGDTVVTFYQALDASQAGRAE